MLLHLGADMQNGRLFEILIISNSLTPHMLYIFGKPWAYPKFGYMSDKAKYGSTFVLKINIQYQNLRILV